MFESLISGSMTLSVFCICVGAAVVLGLLTAGSFMYKNRYSSGLVLTLAVLPAIVAVIIMLVNGNIGAGVAVAGTFSLIRFRSAPGTAREIASLFLDVAIGIACGMGYVGIAAVSFVIVAAVTMLLVGMRFGEREGAAKELRVTIPEDLEYDGLFDDLFEKYTTFHRLERVKTSNMGTLFELRYSVELKNGGISKEFLDAIRCRNGNLPVACGAQHPDETRL